MKLRQIIDKFRKKNIVLQKHVEIGIAVSMLNQVVITFGREPGNTWSFAPDQARNLAQSLWAYADTATAAENAGSTTIN